MAAIYYVILTAAGRAAVAEAFATHGTLDLAALAVGDSNGVYYEPADNQAALVHERWRGALNKVYVHPQHADWIVAEALIPASVGGWEIREAALFDSGGSLLAAAKYPLTSKPAPSSGSETDIYVRLVLQVTNGGEVVQTIDPTLVYATEADLDAHAALTSPHSATSAATPNRLAVRDAAGRMKAAAPAAADDVARKDTVDAHAALTSPHSATSAATANRLVVRDAAGRFKAAAPAAADDVALRSTVTDHANLQNPHSAVSTPTAGRLVLRDGAGRAQFAVPAAGPDAVVFSQFERGGTTDGYQMLPGGLILQWGVSANGGNANMQVHVDFPIQFPNACFMVLAGGKDSGITGALSQCAVKAVAWDQDGADFNIDLFQESPSQTIYPTFLAIGW